MSFITRNVKTYGHVNTGWADRYFSDRFLNANELVCPPYNPRDGLGRDANSNSLITTSAGCNSAVERVTVEGDLRPKYYGNASLNQVGLDGQCNITMSGMKSSEQLVLDSQHDRDLQLLNLGQKIQYYKQLSGMTD